MFTAEQLGSYRALEPIGEGGMGTVYLGEHMLLRQQVAIKLLHDRHSQNPAMEARFYNEARAIAAVDHPGIVKLFDIGRTSDGRAYVVMELLRGETLRKRIGTRGLPMARAVRFAEQIASAMEAAHQRGIVHRDLKPENVFIIRDADVVGGERVKILDFGIAKRTRVGTPGPEITRTGILVGTPSYMPPEQCRGDRELDARADVYAFGVVLYELLSGSLPFSSEDTEALLAHQMYTAPRPIEAVVDDVPPELGAVVMRCIAKKPEDRYQSMAEVAAALAIIAEAQGDDDELADLDQRDDDDRDVSNVATLPNMPAARDATTRLHMRAPAAGLGWRSKAAALTVAAAVGVTMAFQLRGGGESAAHTAQPSLPAPAEASETEPAAAPPDEITELEPMEIERESRPAPPRRAQTAPTPRRAPARSRADKSDKPDKPAPSRRKKPERRAAPTPEPGESLATIEPPTVF